MPLAFPMLRKSLRGMLLEKVKRARKRLLTAMFCYLILALAAVFVLEGFLRAAVLFFIAILAVKTLVHADEEMPE